MAMGMTTITAAGGDSSDSDDHELPEMAMTAGGDSSDSDDHELAVKEPEFIVHIMDDHIPPVPPHKMYRPPPAAAQLDRGGGYVGEDGPTGRECTWCFAIKLLHFGLVMLMVLLTPPLAARLPAEYRTGDRVLLLVGPIVIGVVAFSWMALAIFVDKERC